MPKANLHVHYVNHRTNAKDNTEYYSVSGICPELGLAIAVSMEMDDDSDELFTFMSKPAEGNSEAFNTNQRPVIEFDTDAITVMPEQNSWVDKDGTKKFGDVGGVPLHNTKKSALYKGAFIKGMHFVPFITERPKNSGWFKKPAPVVG